MPIYQTQTWDTEGKPRTREYEAPNAQSAACVAACERWGVEVILIEPNVDQRGQPVAGRWTVRHEGGMYLGKVFAD